MATEDTPGQDKAPTQPTTQPTEQPRTSRQSTTEQPRHASAGQSRPQPAEGGGGLAAALEASHAARVEPADGMSGVDARLDNRAGSHRPPRETFPAKPQQVDGPDVAHQAEHTAATLRDRETDLSDRKGMFSPGPHGLSDESMREGDTTFGTEGLTQADAGAGPKT